MTVKIDTGGKKMVMVFDFDGTISEDDIFDSLFAEYADPEWWKAHRAYHDQELTLKEAYLKMAEHFRGSREDLSAFLRQKARRRKGFKELLNKLSAYHIRSMIISNGFDLYIMYLLKLWQIDYQNLDIKCHHAEIINNRFIPSFQEHERLKHNQCLIGKAEIIQELKDEGSFVCFAGNGYSDTPASRVADLLFARGELADYCMKNQIDYIPYSNFYDVINYLFESQ